MTTEAGSRVPSVIEDDDRSGKTPADLDRIYDRRFSDSDALTKDGIWKSVGRFVQRFVDESLPLVDVACDRGYFVRNIRAVERWATDVRDVSIYLPEDVRFVRTDGPTMDAVLPAGHFGTVWMSNYLEHLPSTDTVLRQLHAAYTVMRRGGRLVILQPNIRLTGAKYWDFLDHKTALTERSLVEAAELAGFRTVKVITRFMPFTTKSRLPRTSWMVDAYLRFPPAWLLLGKQTLYVGERVL